MNKNDDLIPGIILSLRENLTTARDALQEVRDSIARDVSNPEAYRKLAEELARVYVFNKLCRLKIQILYTHACLQKGIDLDAAMGAPIAAHELKEKMADLLAELKPIVKPRKGK
jgi:hypothetical protein